jgi:hypothetical protein
VALLGERRLEAAVTQAVPRAEVNRKTMGIRNERAVRTETVRDRDSISSTFLGRWRVTTMYSRSRNPGAEVLPTRVAAEAPGQGYRS